MDHAGDIIGRYQLLRQLGTGGMGTVWLATRADGTFQREVALKLLHEELRSTEPEGRFLREREILASLDHPGVARILDAGETEDGRPYCAMEAVDGTAIDQHCRESELSDVARLDLVIQAARALGYAHSQHVVHRDIKPQNLMVTSAGQVKLIDFGIARWAQRALKRDAFVTQGPLTYLTPEFASPEQAAGQRIGPSSDVYSLARVAETVLAEGSKSGDLAVVLGAALHPVAEERYATSVGFAADLENVREGRPIAVRRSGGARRLWRMAWRNRDLAAAAIVATLALGVGLTLAAARYHRAQSSLNAAQAQHASTAQQGAEHDASLAQMAREGLVTLRSQGATDRTRAEFITTLASVALEHDAPALRMVAATASLELAEEWHDSDEKRLQRRAQQALERVESLLQFTETDAGLDARRKELASRVEKLRVQ